MAISCKNDNYNLCIVDFVHKAMFLGNTSAPLSNTISRELFRFASASSRMLPEFSFQLQKLLKGFRLVN